jgi:hypothetical protein
MWRQNFARNFLKFREEVPSQNSWSGRCGFSLKHDCNPRIYCNLFKDLSLMESSNIAVMFERRTEKQWEVTDRNDTEMPSRKFPGRSTFDWKSIVEGSSTCFFSYCCYFIYLTTFVECIYYVLKRISVCIMASRKQQENVEYFKYVGILTTNDARYTRESISRIAMAKATSNKKKTSPANWT